MQSPPKEFFPLCPMILFFLIAHGIQWLGRGSPGDEVLYLSPEQAVPANRSNTAHAPQPRETTCWVENAQPDLDLSIETIANKGPVSTSYSARSVVETSVSSRT